MLKKISLAALMAVAGSSFAQSAWISEMMVNPSGDDNLAEYIELEGTPNAPLTGLWLIVVEGDATGRGVVDQRIDLSSYTFGSNGLLLIKNDAATVLPPGAASGTNTVILNFTPDIENGSNTFVLGSGVAPTVGTDLDSNNNGRIDNFTPLAGFSPIDAIGMTSENFTAGELPLQDTDSSYGRQFGGIDFQDLEFVAQGNGWTPDSYYRLAAAGSGRAPGAWISGDNEVIELDQAPAWQNLFNGQSANNQLNTSFVRPYMHPFSAPLLSPGTPNVAWTTASPQAGITGIITGAPAGAQLVIDVLNDDGSAREQLPITVDETGRYYAAITCDPLLPLMSAPGTYTIRARGGTFLSKLAPGITISENTMVTVNFTVRNGDINGDNEVGAADFSILAAAYDATSMDDVYVERADLNLDDEVGAADFSILAANYDEVGE